VGKPEGKDHLEDPGVDGGIILRWIIRKWDVGAWTGLIRWALVNVGNFLTSSRRTLLHGVSR
jgi:hypothetical protein